MATYRVTGPDGASYQVTAPDDATDAQVMQYVQANAKPATKNADANLGGTMQFGPFDTGIKIPPVVESAFVGAGKTFTRLGQGRNRHTTPQRATHRHCRDSLPVTRPIRG
jgi:hypothetical protein